ncbi:MAG TPA: AMP-binding protein [Polyangiaceae bacterium]
MKQNGHTNGHGSSATFVAARAPLDPRALAAGKRIVLLGGTGFLGKIFTSMLLYRFPEIGRVYLLVRKGKAAGAEARFFESIATSETFRPIREKYGDGFEAFLREKVVPIDGDVSLPLCGIDVAAIGKVDAVVNVAGVVDFNPPLDEALDANAFGAQNLVALAKALGPAALLHTSTCYTAGFRKGPILEEQLDVHPFPRSEELGKELWNPEREIADCLDVIAQAKHRCDDAFRHSEFRETAKKNLLKRGEPTQGKPFDEELAKVRRKWVASRLVEAGVERATHWGWPNTYTYTKAIGEQIIARSGLRHAIARPACCETTIEYPFRGWNEGISTTVPFMYLAMKGQTHLPGGRDAILDLIPSDMVASGMILALLELLEGSQAPVYQLGAADVNPCSTARYGELGGIYKRKHWQRKGGNPLVSFVQSHFEPAVVPMASIEKVGAPAFARAARSFASALRAAPLPLAKPAVRALDDVALGQERIAELLRLFAPFSGNTLGPFSCENVRAAYARLPAEYKDVIRWTPETIDWADYYVGIHMPAIEKWIMPEMEKRMVREAKPLRAHATLASLVDEMADRHGHAVALSYLEEGDLFSRITFEDVRARRDAVAARLAAAGVSRGDRVVLAAKNHPDWAIAYFGIVRAGAAAVPMDPDLDPAAFANVVRESGARVAILDVHACERHPNLEGVEVVDLHDVCREGDAAPPEIELLESDLASVIFTSGTTGRPKGVKLTHKNFATMIASLATVFPLRSDDRVLSVLPLHHTLEFSCGLLLPFSRGARVQYVGELNGERLTHALEAGRATAMVGVPALWQVIERRVRAQVDERGPLVKAAFDFAANANRALGRTLGVDAGKVLFSPIHGALGGSLRMLISGGAALPKETQELFLGLGLPLAEGYGLTEAAPVLTASKPSPKTRHGHVGKPVPGVEIKIDHPDDGGVGEVLARGPNVMEGYTDDEATARTLEDGWLRTGDLGKLDKRGQLQIVGRIKDVIVTTTGENVYPDDVERALGEIDGVAELAVVGISSPKGGERIACLAVPKRDSLPPSEGAGEPRDTALSALRSRIASLPYHQQPAVVHVYDAPLPRTSTRKVKRKEVREILERIVLATSAEVDGATEAGPVRVAIAAVSGRSAREIGAHTTLQGDLGFDSLMLTELLEALESRGRAVDAQRLQSCRSVEDVERLFDDAPSRHAARPKPNTKIEGRERDEVRLPPQVQEAAKTVIGKLQDAFYGQIMSSKVTGRAFIPQNRNVIVVANHASHLDMGFVRHALGKYGEDIVSLAAQDYFFDHGIKRAFFENFTNLKAIDRKGGARASLRQASAILSEGKTVLVFPEGTRSPNGDVQEFKSLVGHLALTHGIDILPIYLAGTYESMPRGASVPLKRDIAARIGPPLCIADLRRVTDGKSPAEAAREVARLAREALVALRDKRVFDLSRPEEKREHKHPLVSLFEELEEKFVPGSVDKPVSFYFTLGSDDHSKWTLRIDPARCEVRSGKPDGGTADCVLKTTPEIFTRIVREAYVPGVAEFMSGAVKSNDVGLLQTFQKAFQLG